MIEPPYYPIIYLRGYAGTQGEIEATVSTPYTGFNLGSTRVRQLHTGEVLPYVFESPVIRLMKDHGYVDAYKDGQILPQGPTRGPTPSRSIWIFRSLMERPTAASSSAAGWDGSRGCGTFSIRTTPGTSALGE